MAQPIQIANIDLIDELRRKNGSLIIVSVYKSEKMNCDAISEASAEEMEIWGEERFQLIENGRYEFKINHSEVLQIREIDGIITNYKLEKNSGMIEPGSNVGLLTLELKDEHDCIIYTVALEVRSLKLEYREHYRQMLNEIADECSGLLMQIKSPVKGLFKTDLDEPVELIAQKYAFLKHLISTNEFKSAVARILASPHVNLVSEEEKINITKGFKPTYRALRQLCYKTPRSKVNSSHPLHKILPTIPTNINVLLQKETVDTEENKFVKYVLNSFLQLLRGMEKSIQKQKKLAPSDDRFIRDIVSSKRSLSKILSHSLFIGLSELKTLNLGSSVLQRKSGYKEILSAWIRYNASSKLVWSGGLDVFGGGKRDVDSLYEYWVFFKLLKIVTDVFKLGVTNKENLFEFTEDGFGLKLKAGKSLLINGTCQFNGRSLNIRFAYNRVFNRKNLTQPTANYPEPGTWTKTMRPDYTISVWPKDISERQAEDLELMVHIHFDAKYKLDSPKTSLDLFEMDLEEDLDLEKKSIKSGRSSKRIDLFTLHTYRDAIRRTEGAYIIYPGDVNENWRQYHEILPGLGAFAVRPGEGDQGISNIENFLKDVVTHLTNRTSQREGFRFGINKIFSSISLNAYAELPELDQGSRTLPLNSHYLMVVILDNDDMFCWIRDNLIFPIPLGEGEIDPNIILIKHVFLRTNSGQSSLLKIEGWPHVFAGTTLSSNLFPNANLDTAYLCFNVTQDEKYNSVSDAAIKLNPKSSIEILTLAELFSTKNG